MWIRTTNPQTETLRRPWMDDPVAFNDSGTAQVPADVGERLIDELDAIEEHTNGN